ncbi:MAG: acylneuraminate cytidylyltransferase [Actinobacteria bacterium]|nr:MAG: acylneuraminate cytidylyltransferase [Actinomycetota bacterium]
MRVVAVVQARTGSSRLPGKALMEVGGAPLIVQVLRRVRRATSVDETVLATTNAEQDDTLASLADAEGVSCFRGDEHDVLARVLRAARKANADAIVRLTGDCPLIDPQVVDTVVRELLTHVGTCDYASNVVRRTFPRGLDVEALFTDTLSRVERLASSPEAREHVTWFIYRERPDLFLARSVESPDDFSHLDWSVDTQEDLKRVRGLFDRLQLATRRVTWQEVAVGDMSGAPST